MGVKAKHENVNRQYFDKKAVSSGAFSNFLKTLMDFSYQNGDLDSGTYNDIHIYPADCGAFMVEWSQESWNMSEGGRFEYVAEDESVMIERVMPDNSVEFFFDQDDYEERLADWLKEHPAYYKTSWGTWGNKDEDAALQELLKAEREAKTQPEK